MRLLVFLIRSICFMLLFIFVLFGTVFADDFETVMLPDGTLFESWEPEKHEFAVTYHVDNNNPAASDENPGTASQPWATIQKAADTLEPNERVIIHEGVYREWVKPRRGGDGPEAMISYEAAEGEDVVIKGSDLWTPEWERYTEGYIPDSITVWRAELDPCMFEGANPYALQNFPIQQNKSQWKMFSTFELTRGQLFLDGDPIEQIPHPYHTLEQPENTFWVSWNGMEIVLRLPNDEEPHGKTFELTTREQIFAPTERYLNYIRVKGIRMFHAGNGVPIPPPQRGALSATAGHHWIIEDCEVGYPNTIGIDIGGQWWGLGHGEMQGFHIVRGNHVHHCGVCGLCGWHNLPNQSVLVEDNLFTDNCWMPIVKHWENGNIKLHHLEESVVRRNVILRSNHGAGIWLDGHIYNTRVTQNLLANSEFTYNGVIFLEINHGPNLVDNNIVVNCKSNGYYHHDVERAVITQNLFANGSIDGIMLRWGDPGRLNPPWEGHHRVYGNMVTNFRYLFIRNRPNQLFDYNMLGVWDADSVKAPIVYGQRPKYFGEPVTLEQWRMLGQGEHSFEAPFRVTFDEEDLTLSIMAPNMDELPEWKDYPENLPPGTRLARPGRNREVIPEFAPLEELLTFDLNGRKRKRFSVGPLVDVPLDGTPVNVDPRKGE